jgi:hypothetical protein
VSPVRYELGFHIPDDEILQVTAVETSNLTRIQESVCCNPNTDRTSALPPLSNMLLHLKVRAQRLSDNCKCPVFQLTSAAICEASSVCSAISTLPYSVRL